MKSSLLLSVCTLAVASIFSSCKKTDNSSSSLSPGQGSISFSTSSSAYGDFGGGTNLTNTANLSHNGSRDQITINVIQLSGTSTKTAQLTIMVNAGSTTTGGTIVGDFNSTSSAAVNPVMIIGSTSGTSSGASFASKSGAVNITKLSATEIEGNFSGTFINQSDNSSTTVTNGSFAGKFK